MSQSEPAPERSGSVLRARVEQFLQDTGHGLFLGYLRAMDQADAFQSETERTEKLVSIYGKAVKEKLTPQTIQEDPEKAWNKFIAEPLTLLLRICNLESTEPIVLGGEGRPQTIQPPLTGRKKTGRRESIRRVKRLMIRATVSRFASNVRAQYDMCLKAIDSIEEKFKEEIAFVEAQIEAVRLESIEFLEKIDRLQDTFAFLEQVRTRDVAKARAALRNANNARKLIDKAQVQIEKNEAEADDLYRELVALLERMRDDLIEQANYCREYFLTHLQIVADLGGYNHALHRKLSRFADYFARRQQEENRKTLERRAEQLGISRRELRRIMSGSSEDAEDDSATIEDDSATLEDDSTIEDK